jgi:septal ring factor EnvC (AmiA/AmiB activator)
MLPIKFTSFRLLLASTLLLLGPFTASAQDQANSVESRLRDALKNTMLQLRTVTTDRDNLQAQVTDLQSQNDTLTKQLADLTKKSAADAATAANTITVLKGQVSDQEDSIAKLQTALDQWKASQRQAVDIANKTEDKRAKLAELAIHLQRVVDDQKRKNDEMYKIGMEVLDRYEKFGLGEALTAREPFTGITRTKFETLVQDYEDKLVDQTITENTTQKSPDTKLKQ